MCCQQTKDVKKLLAMKMEEVVEDIKKDAKVPQRTCRGKVCLAPNFTVPTSDGLAWTAPGLNAYYVPHTYMHGDAR